MTDLTSQLHHRRTRRMNHLVQFSTGAGSAEVAWRVVEQYGPEDVVLLAADTLVEKPDPVSADQLDLFGEAV